MRTPDTPANETERLRELRSLGLLDSIAEERFDRITRLAQRMFNVPMALVSLVDEDRQWFKSRVGLEATETSRDVSFCAHAILDKDIFQVPDATKDERFADNPLVLEGPKVRFYAGCPIVGPGGSALGTLCLVSEQPRKLSAEELGSLRDLADLVEYEISTNQLVVTDPLTGLGNRRGFETVASALLEIDRRRAIDTTLLCFDLNKFKLINDQFGHAEGDRALREFADLLMNVLRASDVIARLGGDEFAALLSGTSDQSMAVQRLRDALDRRNAESGRPYALSTSIGVAVRRGDEDETLASLQRRADEAMYHDKRR